MHEEPFESKPNSHSGKVQCRVCGASGYGLLDPTLQTAAPWQIAHMRGHPVACTCGKPMTSLTALEKHVSIHRRHGHSEHGVATVQ